ncbi:XrtY-associated glycosyltransferase XYAG1 [Mucilaginibacter sp. AK015]|uniref:XrtY-associated glycosyltransferase XYAG1 n=1 Tax=Mucilaginibacter sp. AK015 TaxID=2723072 RepID=UPI00160D5191|nr:glycosyltransferase [Mucilaginibacter sp. AK015]MBB5395358.1 glycosyltransferase involved in cell wall biosynthesis [Mucilaginibacter sp. AK015]
MKVLHIIAAYKPAYIYGGPTMSVAMLCEALVKSGVNAEVFATTANGPAELPVEANKPAVVDGVPVTYFTRLTKDHTHFSPALLKALWKRANEFDVIHIHAWWNLVSIFSCLIAIKKSIKVVLSPRGTLSNYAFTNKNSGKKKLIHDLLGKRLLSKCHFHVTSANESTAILKLAKPLTITTIPNYVKLNAAIAGDHRDSPEVLKLLFFSRIEEKKGLDILLEALNNVKAPFSLTIAGTGEEAYIARLKASVTNSEIAGKITWAGFYGDNKFNLLQGHDLLVLPSHDENFGNVVIESLSVGTAVLISGQVGLADYVANNKLGWICKTSADSVSAMINIIATNYGADLARIRETAPQRVRTDFTGDELLLQYIRLYQNIKTHRPQS